MTGDWPKAEIDHQNMNHADNRFSNLRQATKSQNMANKHARSDNTSGFKGVWWLALKGGRGKWQAQVKINGKRIHLGLFDDPQEAALMYATAACAVFGEFAKPAWRDLLADIRGVRGS
jgi:hypothetical protein